MAKKKIREVRFDDKLVLFKFCLSELGITDWKHLRETLNRTEEEGINPATGNTRFLDHLIHQPGSHVTPDRLRVYDENIMRHTRQIGQNRGGLTWKYFQYLSLLFTEMYLDRYFNDREELCAELNDCMRRLYDELMGLVEFTEQFNKERMNKLVFMCATGSGKTLILHVNLLQYLHYMHRAQRANSRININKVILLTPNEGMSRQHKEELDLSGIRAAIFQKDGMQDEQKEDVCIIDINKLEEEGKDKTVSVDSFERKNLLLVDEGHRGLSSGGKVWLDYRKRLAEDGFTFEYSATFKQALNVNATSAAERALADDYCKAIIMDYSYKYFYEDGYGKDYRIFNLTTDDRELRTLYLTGCLLSFYQQKKCFREYRTQIAPFNIEDPLMVFVGNRVTTTTSKDELTDVEDVVMFIDQFVRNKQQSIRRIEMVLQQRTGLLNEKGDELFTHDFTALYDMNGGAVDAKKTFEDLLFVVFNTTTMAEEPRLHLEHLRQTNEIALRVGDDGKHFGVISIGDAQKLKAMCEKKGVVTKTDPIFNRSLFDDINRRGSEINVLIGSRKFTEGWNSWRVSTIGLINFAKGEGSQAIQMFGRGVRLKGYQGLLKRSHALSSSVHEPQVKHIGKLETLTLFGVKANYMMEFKKFLETENVSSNENVTEVTLPVVSRYEKVKSKRLRVIRVRGDKNFKRDARRMLLSVPDEKFKTYLVKNKVSIDCRSKVQTIDVTNTMQLGAELPVNSMPRENIAVLDYQYLYDELQEYKNEKSYFNLSIEKDGLHKILEDTDWYEFIIPRQHLEIDSMRKLEDMNDFCLMALKAYVEKFYKFEKERWEDQYLEYAELDATDNNFVDEYSLTLTEDAGGDYGKELERFINDATVILNSQSSLDSYDSRQALAGNLVLFDFRYHLYAPLVCVKKSNLKIQVSPVSMNADEKLFVDHLEHYVNTHADWLKDKSLYLLRNKSKVGMGFFEAGNFYPDYILWIDTLEVQYISFIDPKGLLHFTPQDDKIKFYKKIKELEARLAHSAGDKRIVLNSFIMSATKAAQLKQWWHMTTEEYEAMNVYTLDDSRCVEKMLEKIEIQVAI